MSYLELALLLDCCRLSELLVWLTWGKSLLLVVGYTKRVQLSDLPSDRFIVSAVIDDDFLIVTFQCFIYSEFKLILLPYLAKYTHFLNIYVCAVFNPVYKKLHLYSTHLSSHFSCAEKLNCWLDCVHRKDFFSEWMNCYMYVLLRGCMEEEVVLDLDSENQVSHPEFRVCFTQQKHFGELGKDHHCD